MDFKKQLERITRRIGQIVSKGERDVAKRYAKTLVEIRSVLSKYYEKYEKDGALSYEDMAKHNRLKKMQKEINHLLKVNRKEINKQMERIIGDTYMEGYYLTAWAVESYAKTKLSYTSVTPETLTAMLRNPVAGLTLNERLERNRVALVYKIQQEITQGLQNNEPYGKMAKRLKKSLEGDATKAMRITRTEGHRVQESAKHDSVEHANKNGVIMMKTWNSMEDVRVRKGVADHRDLNETTIPTDEMFDDGLSQGPAPGLLPAAGSSINCRCFLTYSIDHIEKPQHDELENMAFDEWKNERLKGS